MFFRKRKSQPTIKCSSGLGIEVATVIGIQPEKRGILGVLQVFNTRSEVQYGSMAFLRKCPWE